MRDLLKDMTPIQWVGASFIGFMALTAAATFTMLVWATVTGEADLANASYGIADTLQK